MLKIKDTEHRQIADYIKKNYGIELHDKKVLVDSRLSYELMNLDYDNYDDFLKVALHDHTSKEHELMINKLTTNHTFFMRESAHFDFLKNEILTTLSNNNLDKNIRIWSAGCSSGEEAYNIAMVLSDHLGMNSMLWDARILATDISSDVLKKGIEGIYSSESLINIPQRWISTYFQKINDQQYQITESLAKKVTFAIFNLQTETFPFKKKFNVIFCRNVMIYFNLDTRKKLIEKFYDHLEVGGYLIIGHSETFPRDWANFEYVTTSIYRKV